MRVINYDKEMVKLIAELEKEGKKPTLLLHACCAPCASYCIECLKDAFDLTVYFYNPNMDRMEEHLHRASELERLCEKMGVKSIIEKFTPKEFFDKIKGLESEIEGGKRCNECFSLRLEKTANTAKEKGFTYFATTLTVSPLKNAKVLNETGKTLEEKTGVKYLCTDFKKRNGYIRSIELSREFDLYRQNYCGCIFSKNSIV